MDVDGDPLTFEVVGAPEHGRLTGTPPLVTYTPGAHFTGEDAFSFTVSDGGLTSEPAVVRVTVDGVVRRELDGDASWFGCTAAPGVGKMRKQSFRTPWESQWTLLFIALGLVWLRRRSRG